jgi:hypothetical protein
MAGTVMVVPFESFHFTLALQFVCFSGSCPTFGLAGCKSVLNPWSADVENIPDVHHKFRFRSMQKDQDNLKVHMSSLDADQCRRTRMIRKYT